MIYLACPYTHPDSAVMEARFRAATHAAGRLILKGNQVFSPLSHSHPINMAVLATQGHEVWIPIDLNVIRRACDRLYVLMINGWSTSHGVNQEITLAFAAGIPVSHWGAEHFGLTAEFPYFTDIGPALYNSSRPLRDDDPIHTDYDYETE